MPMLTFDPVRLAQRQIEIDRARVARFPHLMAHKSARMIPSPLALLRGSAPLYYELVAHDRWLYKGPRGKGWLVGDAHVENFGAYRAGALTTRQTTRGGAKEPVVFDLNDFDDAIVGAWRLDVVRLATSMVLGARAVGTDGARTLAAGHALVDAYVAAAFLGRRAPAAPPVVTHLVDEVRTRSRKAFLDARTEIVGGQRRFVRGARYEDLTPKLRSKSERAFVRYAKTLRKSMALAPEALEVVDVAFRVAGTGSLGSLRVAVLARGRGDLDGGWIFDMKSQGEPAASNIAGVPDLDPAERVNVAMEACLARPPRMIGATHVADRSLSVRRLAPQEDKLDFSKLDADDLEPLARHLGALLGLAHVRGAVRPPDEEWTPEERAGLISRAIALAGIHEGIYLAYCELVG
jgi:uncharacterized protein (DUF2252 family)